MQQFDYQKEISSTFSSEEEFSLNGEIVNPFPGLRPFEIDEFHLFFGREKQVDSILLKLSEHRFIGVLGYSGSGKSSIMYCGVIPMLYGGFMTNTGSDWNIITTRPGSNPLENLTKSILESFNPDFAKDKSEEEVRVVIKTLLKSGSDGITRVISQFDKGKKRNHFILIDQFEELFRFREEKSTAEAYEESVAFVELLIDAIRQTDQSIYIALTMRSDYVGDCSVYNGLTRLINRSNYLVPRMNHAQKRMAIEGPVAVGGGKIANRLVYRLLSEIGDNQDQLPILQHALMRTWNYWLRHKEHGEVMDIRHYNAVGKMSGALSQHADEIFDELNPKQKTIAEILFKALTQKGQDNQGIRRAAVLGDIAELSKVPVEQVIEVVEHFRRPGRSFLMPAAGIELTENSILEISHESLMRIWVRLKTWVDEEYESAQMYNRLSEAAAMYQVGRTGLWRPPDLQLALNWQKKQKPTRAWAARYNEAFERAIVFLDTSRITYEAEQRNQEMLQNRLLKRARMVALILGAAAIIAIVFFIYGVVQQNAAEAQRREAEDNLIAAQRAQQEAVEQRRRAEESAENEKEQRQIVDQQAQQLEVVVDSLENTNFELARVIRSEQEARRIAEREQENAKLQTRIAEREKITADSAKNVAEQRSNEVEQLLYLTVARDISQKSIPVEDDNLKGLLALQAFQFNKNYNGKKYDPYIYNGLYSAISKIEGKTYNTKSLHRGPVRSVVSSDSLNEFYTTGADGMVIRTNVETGESETIMQNRFSGNEIVAVSRDNQYVVVGGDSSYVYVFSPSAENTEPNKIVIHESGIKDIDFLTDNNFIVTSGEDERIMMTNIVTGKSRQIKGTGTEFNDIEISPSGESLAAAGENGKVSVFALNNFEEQVIVEANPIPAKSLSFSPDGKLLGIGNENGEVILWNLETNSLMKKLIGHSSRVSDIEFSNDGQLIASSSLDKTINLWVMNGLDDLPIVLNDNDSHVWDIEFTDDSDYLLAACTDGEVRIWATLADKMAEVMCSKLTRNLTEEEWKVYINNPIIPYRTTCEEEVTDQ